MAPTAIAAEMGALVGFLSAKVLGQYDPYAGLVSERAAPIMKRTVRSRFICAGSKLLRSVAARPADPGWKPCSRSMMVEA